MPRHRLDTQGRLIEALNPVIRGWSPYCSTLCSHERGEQMDEQRRPQLRSWSRFRHPHKRRKGGDQKYWRHEAGPWNCQPRAWGKRWGVRAETPIQLHVQVPGGAAPTMAMKLTGVAAVHTILASPGESRAS